MVPRYRPEFDSAAWVRWARSSAATVTAARAAVIDRLAGPGGPRSGLAFSTARQALFTYFSRLRDTSGGGSVLVPAQICPVVAHVVRRAGFELRFVDLDDAFPTPSPAQYRDAIDEKTVAAIVCPLYGYLPKDWSPLVEPRRVRVVLDLAQALLLADRLDRRLLEQADAIAYSFGLGKGLDTGGALLLTPHPVPVNGHGATAAATASVVLKGLALRGLIATGLYRYAVSRLERELEAAVSFEPDLRARGSESLYPLWEARLWRFASEVERARERAIALQRLPAVRRACRNLDVFCDPEALHLRQILRLSDPTARASVIASLRLSGIDCAQAGEPLPQEYLSLADPPAVPRAARFRSDAVRLPFLGRVSEREFERLQQALERALA
jgi:dTDP-4-amino-4,6-dideoxygalactose transaminase